MVVVYCLHTHPQYSSDHSSVCSQPGIGILSQNFVPNFLKLCVSARARAIFIPSTRTSRSFGWVKYPALITGFSYGLAFCKRMWPLLFGLRSMGTILLQKSQYDYFVLDTMSFRLQDVSNTVILPTTVCLLWRFAYLVGETTLLLT